MLACLQRAAPLYLAWMGLLCGSILLMLVPDRLSFIQPGNFLLCLVQVQLFFVVVCWPLGLPALLRDRAHGAEPLAQVAGLPVLAIPLLLPAANISNAGAASVLGGQSLVSAWALLASGLWAFGQSRKRAVGPAYFLAAFLLSAFLPFWGFLSREFGGSGLEGLAYVSPFWAAAVAGPPIWVQASVAGASGLTLLLLGARPGRVDAPAASG